MIRRINIQSQTLNISAPRNGVSKSQLPSDPPPDYRDINNRGHLSLEEANRLYLNFDPPPPYEPTNTQITPVGLPSYEYATRDSHSTQTENTNNNGNPETIPTNSNNSNSQISTIFNNMSQSNQQTNNRSRRNPFSGCCNCFGRIFNRNRNNNTSEHQNPLPSYETVLELSIRQHRRAILELDNRICSRIDYCRSNGINTGRDSQLSELREQRNHMYENLQELLCRL